MGYVSDKANIYRGKHAGLRTMNDFKEMNYFYDPSSKISSKHDDGRKKIISKYKIKRL